MKRTVYSALVFAAAAAAAVALTAVASGCLITYDPDKVDQDAFIPDDDSVRIIVVSPAPSQTFASELAVLLELRNLTLVAPAGQANNPNEGHLRVFIDEVCLDDTANPGPGPDHICENPRAITEIEFTVPLTDLAAGTHRFQVELRNNDGSLSGSVAAILIDFEKTE